MGAVALIRKALQVSLPDLSVSDASIEAKIIDVVGSYADSEAVNRQASLDTIATALATQKTTTVEYYRRKAVAFQQGDALIYDHVNQGGYYAEIDEEKQIIKQAYIVKNFPYFTLLVNKLGDDGHLTTLTADELASFKTYFEAFQPLGCELGINSLPVAVITDPNITIYVEAGSDATEVAAAINANFLAQEAVLRNYNQVSLSEISDIIQRVPQVKAIGYGTPSATEVNLAGETITVLPVKGLFNFITGAFRFGTEITPDMIKTIQ